jgi:Protein of unknown function (DUF3747)
MKPSSVVYTTALLWSLGFTASQLVRPAAAAAAFDQKELDPNRVIAVAVPLAQGARYNLLILEQLSDAKQCWQQNPSNPTLIDPLLLQFDFTGICGRSTDSNGYSVRIAGQDRALDYRLSIAKENDHLVLWAVPSRNAQSPALAIGRTQTLTSGFLKLQLNPDWRFTKRTYGGKTLGHIYLTRDTEGGAGNIATATPTSTYTKGGQTPLFRPSTTGRTLGAKLSQRSVTSSSNRLNPITAPIQIPVPASSAFGRPRRPTLAAAPSVFPIAPPPNNNSLPTVAAGILPVPQSTIPMGNAGNEPDIITAANTPNLNLNGMAPGSAGSGLGANPPFKIAMANYRYRVYVKTVNNNQRQAVKTLVPDSFRSFYQGQPMMQVGAFQDRVKADEVIDLLNRNGINSILATE